MSDSNIGRKVHNRYELLELIGQGSMGRVYLAGDSSLGGVPVAVKFLSQTLLNENMRTRFFTEAMTCAQLGQKSMHVIRVSDYGVDKEDVPFYVMEYLQGESVGQILKKRPIPVRQFIDLTKQILRGLRTAHSGILVEGEIVPIIHRDIKPSNILVTADPSMGELVKILDFGIAKLMQAGSEQTSTFMGTLAYASPEQMEGRELDVRSDIYSLGVLMYQMLSGRLPVKPTKNTFGSWYKVHRLATPKSLTDFHPIIKVPAVLEDVVLACLSKQREDRPASADQILEAISTIEADIERGSLEVDILDETITKFSYEQGSELQIEELGTGSSHASRNAARQRRADTNSKQRRSLAEDESLIRDLEALLEDDLSVGSSLNSSLPTAAPKQTPPESAFYLQQNWPSEMPIAQIVFPKLLTPPAKTAVSISESDLDRDVSDQTRDLSTLWAMMPESEIKRRVRDVRYNNFLCTMSPHPMVLWLTAFYSKVEGPRWLPCYLDLKDPSAQKILWTLSETQHYRILFFTKEAPHSCIHQRKLTIAPDQLQLFKDWTTAAASHQSVSNPQDSKALLKQELDTNLKPKILMHFAATFSDTHTGIEVSA